MSNSKASLTISPWLCGWFLWYLRGYFPKHFHAIRVSYEDRNALPKSGAIACYINHGGWWDPLTAFFMNHHLFPERLPFAPMDSEALARYPFLEKIGLFGVDAHSPKGAVQLLRTSRAIFEREDATLWITPQGRFADVRERPLKFERGLGHLAAEIKDLTLIPVAVEYCFWNERLPELLVRVGRPISSSEVERSTDEWTEYLEECLTTTMDALSLDAQRRDGNSFTTILAGRAGVSGFYDRLRRVSAWRRGQKFRAEHDVRED
ncbi:lysophospholipid acyltransferase family protein [Calycomorphotria hydatis]|uniref:Acyltransferase n=1 Tax=Calycomorphotria hydatis TaxID=2528027 RepID=A0A517T5S8_9PLAN|nr:lysophospholipid acyltransferase family protein [Calycomorphotria hydatis]QDT63711.1 Acyltransferase [Calycomorphotria hydatis]